MTSGCLIGVETTGVTGNTVAVSSAERPNACRIQGDPPSLVRYHGEPGNYSRHATTYAASMPPRPVRLRVSSPTPSRSPNPPPRPFSLLLSFSISPLRRKSHPLPSRFVPFFSSKSGSTYWDGFDRVFSRGSRFSRDRSPSIGGGRGNPPF